MARLGSARLGRPVSDDVLGHSTELWSLALGAGEGFSHIKSDKALHQLCRQLAFAFRGVLSFWFSAELTDAVLQLNARELAEALMRFERHR